MVTSKTFRLPDDFFSVSILQSNSEKKSVVTQYISPLEATLQPTILKSSTRGLDHKERYFFEDGQQVSKAYNKCKKHLKLIC